MTTDPLKARFEDVDRNGDGAIDEAEFAVLLDALGAGYTEAQVHAAFTDIDHDSSGVIELEELRKWWTSD